MNNYLFWKRFAQGKLKTHVSSVKIRIPSPKEILSWSERRLPNSTLVGKIDNAHTVEHDTLRPVSGGLFCERIFGPIATNVCACLRRKGWNEDYCKICEVQFTKSRLRRYQMGHILLAAPVIHIWALQGGYLANLLGKKNLGVRSIAYGKVMSQSKLWKPNNKGIRQIKYLTPNLEESLPLLSFRRASGFTSVTKKSRFFLLTNRRFVRPASQNCLKEVKHVVAASNKSKICKKEKSTICEKEKLGAKLPKAVLHNTTKGNSTATTALGGRATRLATCLYDEGWSQIPAVTKAVRYQVGEALLSPKAAKQEATFGENKQHHKGKEKQSILKTKLFEKPFYFGDDNLLISFVNSYVNKETLPYKGKIKDQTRKAYERGNVLPFHQFILYKPDTFNKITQFFNSLDKGQATTPNLERNFSFGEAFDRSIAAFVDTRPNFDVASDSTMKFRSESCPTIFTIENSSLSSLSEGKIEDLLQGKIVAKNQRFTEGNEIILPLPHYSKQKLVVLQNKTIRYTSSLGTLMPKFRPSTLDPCFAASPKEKSTICEKEKSTICEKEKSTICEKEKSSICKKEKLGDHSAEGSFARSYEGKTALPAEKLAKLPSAIGAIKSKDKTFLILQSPLDERSIQPNQKNTIRDFGIFSRSDTLYWGMFYDSYLESIFYVPSLRRKNRRFVRRKVASRDLSKLVVSQVEFKNPKSKKRSSSYFPSYKSSIFPSERGNVKDRPKAATHPLALLASHPEVRQNREIKSIPLDKLFNELIVQNRFNSVIAFGSYLRSTHNTLLLSSRPTFVASHAMICKIKRTSRVKPFASQEVRPKGALALQSTSFARRTNLIASNSFKVNNISRVKLAFASTPNFVKTDLSFRFRLSEGKIKDLKVNPEEKIKDLKVNPEKEIEDLLEGRKLEIDANKLTYSKMVKRTKPSLIDIKNIAYAGSSVLFQSLKNLNLVLLYSLINWKWEKSKIELDKFLLQNKLTKKKRNLRNKIAKTKIILTKRKNLVQSFLNTSQLPEWMIISILPVLPPALRPILELEPNNVVVSDLNVLYQTVIRRNNALMGLLSFRALEIDILNRQVSLQQAIEKLFDKGAGTKKRPVKSLSQGFHGKKGLFRSHLLGKRVDYSGRSVIVVGPQLKLHECGLPKEMALILFLPFLIARLKKRKVVANTSQAKQLILHKDKQIWNHLKSLIYEHPVLLNRAPTLHRLGFQAFQPILVSGKAMILPALVCTGFNADFDGDQMAVHIPLSHVARAESWKLLHAKNNMLSPATGKPIVVLSQEMILGCYCSSLILNFTHSYRKSSSPKEKSTICEKERLNDHNMKAWQKGAGLTNWRFKSKPRRKNLDFLGTLVKPEATIENKRCLETPISDLPKTLGRKITKKCFAASSSAYTEYNNLPNLPNNRVATNLSKLNLVKLNLLSVAKPKLRKNLYFTTFQDIYKALGTNKIAIQTAVWLRIPFFEDNQFLEEPLEIRFDAMGHFFRSYCQSQRHFSKNIKSKDQLKGISYIRTSAGRIQLNETFYSSWS